MSAYKFLAKGAVGPISGFRWPTPQGRAPGAWVGVEGPLSLCTNGVHVCGAHDLAHWLHDELWSIETEGECVEGVDCVVARRARLVRRIDAWNDRGAVRFASECIGHAASLIGPNPSEPVRGFLEDAKEAARGGYVAVSAFCAALATSKSAAPDVAEQAYRGEREWQANWIVRELIAR
jgi:hypothetical protein